MLEFNNVYANAYQSGKLLVIKFFATWCGPCKTIAPHYDEMVVEYPNVICCKVDGDIGKEIKQRYKINAYPTFIFLKGGK